MKIILTRMPIPPSVNKQMTLARGRFIKSSLARDYDLSFIQWANRNNEQLLNARRELSKQWILGKRELCIALYYCFERSKLITKTNTLKKLDVDNRAKSAIDHITKLIGQDDCFIIKNINEKVISNDGVNEMIAVITLTGLKTKENIYEEIKKRPGI